MIRKQKMHDPLPFSFGDVIKTIADDQKPLDERIPAKPFLKWVGGKRSILQSLTDRLPENYGRYHECFIGGGALFFDTQPKLATISDINFHLIVTYCAVRDNVDSVIKQLQSHKKKHCKDHYLKSRERLSKESDPIKLAGLLIYINKTCYNGLYRVNMSGKFNVPMGSYKNPNILDDTNLHNVSKVLQGITIEQKSFEQCEPKKGDFYYLDPPYHQTYNGYNGKGFADDKHEALAELCHKIDKVGGYFMLSNSDTDFIRTLYKKYDIEDILAGRYVSCKPDQRGKKSELLIRNYE